MLNEKLQNDIAKAEEQLHHALVKDNYDRFGHWYKVQKGIFNAKLDSMKMDVEGAYRVGLIDEIKCNEVLLGIENARHGVANRHANEMKQMYGERETNIRWWIDLGRSREEAERLEDEAEEVE